MAYLIAGATGNVGGAAARFLLEKKKAHVRCLVRDAKSEKAKELAALGAKLISGSFEEPELWAEEALDGGLRGALLVSNNSLEQVTLERSFIQALAGSNVYLLKVSTCSDYVTAESPIQYGALQHQIEATLEATMGLQWTVLNPNIYMQNHLGDIFGTLPRKLLAYPRSKTELSSGRASLVDTRDVGEIAAKFLLLDDPSLHHGKKYSVCGPKGWSVKDLAAAYETALNLPGDTIRCEADLSESAFANGLVENAHFPQWLAVAVARSQVLFWASGKLEYPSSEAVLALHPTFRTFESWASEHAPMVKFLE